MLPFLSLHHQADLSLQESVHCIGVSKQCSKDCTSAQSLYSVPPLALLSYLVSHLRCSCFHLVAAIDAVTGAETTLATIILERGVN